MLIQNNCRHKQPILLPAVYHGKYVSCKRAILALPPLKKEVSPKYFCASLGWSLRSSLWSMQLGREHPSRFPWKTFKTSKWAGGQFQLQVGNYGWFFIFPAFGLFQSLRRGAGGATAFTPVPLHMIALYIIPLHFNVLHCVKINCTVSKCSALHIIQCIARLGLAWHYYYTVDGQLYHHYCSAVASIYSLAWL